MKVCSKCRTEQPLDGFHRNHRASDGRQSECKSCLVARRKKIACTVTVVEKPCTRCQRTLPIDHFAQNRAARDGHQSYCRECSYAASREYLERNAELVALRQAQKLLEPIGADKVKLCRGCNREKPLLEFYAHRGTKDRRATYCKECARAYDVQRRAKDREKYVENLREWRAANVERRKELMRTWNLRLYGLRPEDYIAMYERQQGRCAICGENGETFGGRRLHIDHDHDTGKVRGLLCGLCNTAIGHLKDSPTLLRAAASYLEVSNG